MSYRVGSAPNSGVIDRFCASVFWLVSGLKVEAPVVTPKTATPQGHHIPRSKKPLDMSPRRMH